MSAASDWSREAINALIQAYKDQPLLYNTKMTPLYYNKNARQTAIDKILIEVLAHRPETTSYDIIKKIQVLRTQYGQEVAKINRSRKFGDEYTYTPKIWWFSELSFLQEHMKKRPSMGTKKEPSSDGEDESDNNHKILKRQRLSDENITIVDKNGTPITDVASPSPSKSNKYVIYEDNSYVDSNDPHQSEIIVEPYTKPVEVKRHEEIGKFVAAQMATIKDDILFYQTQHEILTVINNANLKQLEKNLSGGRVISVALETE